MLRNKITSSSGIYQIQSTVNGKIYIGSAVNLLKRKREHFFKLKIGKHHSIYLQRHYNKYGKDDLIFSIIEFCLQNKLVEREQFYIDTLNPKFNICLIAGSSLGIKYREEVKQKMKEDFYKNHTQISFKKQGVSLKKKWGNDKIFRNKQLKSKEKYWEDSNNRKSRSILSNKFWNSKEGITEKEKVSRRFSGVLKSKEHNQKNTEGLLSFYKTQEGILLKQKKSERMKLNNHMKTPEVMQKIYVAVNQYDLKGRFIIIYSSILEASKQTNIPRGDISNCINNKQKTAGGYIWKRA